MFTRKKKIEVKIDSENECVEVNGKKAKPFSSGNVGRSVYVIGEYIIKLDNRGYHHDDLGVLSRIKPHDRKYFVPIIAQGESDGVRWSVQPFLDLDETHKPDEAEFIIDSLIVKYDLADLHRSNWALHNGQPIIFDYGMD